MNRGFHCCRHRQSTDQYIGLHVEYKCLFCEIQFVLSQVLEDFLKISMVGDLHIVEVQSCPVNLIVITSHQIPGAPRTCTLTTTHKCPGAPKRIVILLPLLRMCCRVLVVVSHQFPGDPRNRTLIKLVIPRAFRSSRILRRILLCAREVP